MQTRVLVVEDSTTQAIALQAVLEENGFAATRMASGEEAIEHLARHEVDLVLSDIVMPGISGYDLCRHIKADERLATLPVVLLTSLSDPVDIVRGLECGADNYVTKPYEPEYLCARIRHVLDRQRLRRIPKASLGVNVSFLGTSFSINSDKEQILDLFISSVEEVVRTNSALQESQRELAEAQQRLEENARSLALEARVSAEKYSLLMHEANDAIMVLDMDGRIREANVRACELLGRAQPELGGRPLEQFALDDSVGELRTQFASLRSAPRVEASELAFDRAGTRVYCDFSASRTRSDEGELVLAILHDVTDLKRTVERLRRSESLLAEAERLAMFGSFESDLRTGSTQWSASLWCILGLDATEQVPSFELLLTIVHPEDREMLVAAQKESIATGRPLDVEMRIMRPDGTWRMAQVRAEVRLGDHGEPRRIWGTVQDVTERKQLEEQLLQSQKMEAVGQLAGGVAHDFNNLLTVITSYSGLILSALPDEDPNRADLEEIQDAAHRAAALTRQLLAFSRRQVLQPQLVDINSLTTNLEKLLRRLVREDIDIVTSLDPRIGLVWADPGQLEQVLVNLVVNARDAMPEGGKLTIRTQHVEEGLPEPLAHVENGCVLIEVSDEGTGMAPEVQSRIFEPFFTTKEQGQGTGLGLSTVYGIVSQSGGEIQVWSAPGEGTTFRIVLPCREGEPEAREPVRTSPAEQRGGGTVLLVEDDEALRAVACRILQRHGYTVLTASNGREALEVFESHADELLLVVTDMVMPEMSGFELREAMLRRRADIRMLFMSGYTRDTVEREGLASGNVTYLEKPFTVDELASKVRDVLAAPVARE